MIGDYLNDEEREGARELKNSKVRRFLGSLDLRARAFAGLVSLLLAPGGWKELDNHILYNKKEMVGFLAGSIIQNPLYYPDEGNVEFLSTGAGNWLGFDFRRNQGFQKGVYGPLRGGKLASFLIEDIKDNDPQQLTPTGYLNLFDVYHMAQMEFPIMDYLVKNGLVSTSTYAKSFEKAGEYSQFKGMLKELGIAEKPIFEVTPKGNGLVFLVEVEGEKRPKESVDFAPSWVPAPSRY